MWKLLLCINSIKCMIRNRCRFCPLTLLPWHYCQSFLFWNWMFCLPFESVAGGIFQITNIFPSLLKCVDIQHTGCSRKNIIFNKKENLVVLPSSQAVCCFSSLHAARKCTQKNTDLCIAHTVSYFASIALRCILKIRRCYRNFIMHN